MEFKKILVKYISNRVLKLCGVLCIFCKAAVLLVFSHKNLLSQYTERSDKSRIYDIWETSDITCINHSARVLKTPSLSIFGMTFNSLLIVFLQ